MRKVLTSFIVIILSISGSFLALGELATAATNNNNLIDDSIFDSTGTMTPAQIDTWINANFPNSCISTNSGFTAPDPVGYSPNYPHPDGRYLYGSPVSAGRVIYDAALGHQINPQVLLTKLQNEEGLVAGNGVYGCSATALTAAVGYACTDSGTYTHSYTYTGADPFADSTALPTPLYYRNGNPVNSISGNCVNTNVYAGFSEQVVHAAWALSIWRHKSEGQTNWAAISGNWNHCDDINTCPPNMNIPAGWACYGGLMTQGYSKRCPTDSSSIYYDGYATIDGQALHMDNGATAALYVYTPHIQSFTTIFTNFFGDPHSPCIADTNVSGASSGQSVQAYLYSGAKLAFLQMNNTRSACTEAHIWNSGYQSWATHIATAMKSIDPSAGILVPSWSSIDNKEALNYVLFNPGGNLEVHRLSPDFKKFPGYYDVASNLSGVSATNGTVVSGDFLGRGYDQLAYIMYSGSQGTVEVHLFDPSLRKAVGYYDVASNLSGVNATSGKFVSGDFLGRGYDQLVYIMYNGASGHTEVHMFDRTLRTAIGFYDVPTNFSGLSTNAGTFVGGDFLGRGYDQMAYVMYNGTSTGMIEVHTFTPNLRQGVGFQDIATNLPAFDPTQ